MFSVLFRLHLSVVRSNRSQVVRIELLCISMSQCAFTQGAQRHRNTRELYSNDLRAVGPNYAQLKTKQNRKQDYKTRNKDQNKVNK